MVYDRSDIISISLAVEPSQRSPPSFVVRPFDFCCYSLPLILSLTRTYLHSIATGLDQLLGWWDLDLSPVSPSAPGPLKVVPECPANRCFKLLPVRISRCSFALVGNRIHGDQFLVELTTSPPYFLVWRILAQSDTDHSCITQANGLRFRPASSPRSSLPMSGPSSHGSISPSSWAVQPLACSTLAIGSDASPPASLPLSPWRP